LIELTNGGRSDDDQATYQLIEVLPVILRHQPESAQHRPAEVVKVGVTKVRVVAGPLTHVTVWT